VLRLSSCGRTPAGRPGQHEDTFVTNPTDIPTLVDAVLEAATYLGGLCLQGRPVKEIWAAKDAAAAAAVALIGGDALKARDQAVAAGDVERALAYDQVQEGVYQLMVDTMVLALNQSPTPFKPEAMDNIRLGALRLRALDARAKLGQAAPNMRPPGSATTPRLSRPVTLKQLAKIYGVEPRMMRTLLAGGTPHGRKQGRQTWFIDLNTVGDETIRQRLEPTGRG
jgi:hypothetical protein